MGNPRVFLVAAAVLLLAGATAQARVSHGYSGVLAIDTVTAVGDDANALPRATTLAAIYPNPFNPRTMIEYELAEAGQVDLAIYDLRGRLVRLIVSSPLPAGRHQAAWDGRDDEGRPAPTGAYFCRLRTPQGSQTRKLMLAR